MAKTSGGVRKNSSPPSFNKHVEGYISGDEMWINSWLRGEKNFKLNSGEKAVLSGLDKATDKPLGKNMTLYRSVDASAIFGNIDQGDYESLYNVLAYGDTQKYNVAIANKVLSKSSIGSIYTEKGFMSTTKSASMANDWGGFSGSEKPIVMKITVPKKTKGIDVSKHSMEQDEILLKRGQKYKVNKIYGNSSNIYVDVTII